MGIPLIPRDSSIPHAPLEQQGMHTPLRAARGLDGLVLPTPSSAASGESPAHSRCFSSASWGLGKVVASPRAFLPGSGTEYTRGFEVGNLEIITYCSFLPSLQTQISGICIPPDASYILLAPSIPALSSKLKRQIFPSRSPLLWFQLLPPAQLILQDLVANILYTVRL